MPFGVVGLWPMANGEKKSSQEIHRRQVENLHRTKIIGIDTHSLWARVETVFLNNRISFCDARTHRPDAISEREAFEMTGNTGTGMMETEVYGQNRLIPINLLAVIFQRIADFVS